MKKILFIFALSFVSITSNAQTWLEGDLDGDGVLSVSDVMELVELILFGEQFQAYLTCPDDHHPHMIDLGLPSGMKWACCNVGANKPEAYGGYYAWGETEEKSTYNLSTYTYYNESEDTFQDLGEDIAGTDYDVATVRWGWPWMMPSEELQNELIDNCTYQWTTMNGVKGGKFTSKINGGSIFLPASGRIQNSDVEEVGTWGIYLSSMLSSWLGDGFASVLSFESDNATWGDIGYRDDGQCVRPVADNNVTVNLVGDLDGDGAISVSDVMELVKIILYGDSPQAYLTCPDDDHPHLIDLGLPSGTKWACCNVEADKPEAYGGYYAWGETETKSTYNSSNYIHCEGSMETCHDLGSDIAGTVYDVAHVKWGGSWVMPSQEQQDELLTNCTSEWTTVNGVNGRKFTSKINGGSIFLPAAGVRWYDDIYDPVNGYYWSSTQYPLYEYLYNAFNLYFDSDVAGFSINYREIGHMVRPVYK